MNQSIGKLYKFFADKEFRMRTISGLGLYNHVSDEKYLKKLYKLKVGKELNLDNPQTYNEKLQWLKIHDRNPIYTTMVDKFDAKQYVADRVGNKYVIPALGVWDCFDDVDFEALPDSFVLKCTHDSGGLVIVRDKRKLDMLAAKKRIEKCLKNNYYRYGREWPYKNVVPRIIAESYIGTHFDGETSQVKYGDSVTCDELQNMHGLLDYKFMCFNGIVRALFLDIGVIGRGDGHADEYYRNVYDRNGVLLPVRETRENYAKKVILPDNLNEMIMVAETLSAGIPHLRVDLYRLNTGEIKVGEMTFFHGSGTTNNFVPESWNKTFGDWLDLSIVQKQKH